MNTIYFFNADKKVTLIYLANIFCVVLSAWRKYINKLKRRKLLMSCGLVHKKYIYFDNEFSKKMRLANTEDKVKEIMREFEESYKFYRNINLKKRRI